MIAYLECKGCLYSIAVTQHKRIAERIALIPEDAWQPVPDYPEAGICELAETTYCGRRLVVRRVHLHAQESQEELFAYWRHFAFLTNRTEDMHTVDREHRQHAEVELAIRDLKDQALAHFPSGQFSANAAWTVIACLAHNMVRWVGQLGLEDDLAHRAGDPPLADRATGSAHAHGQAFHTPPAGPLALAGSIRRGSRQDQGAAGRGLTLPDTPSSRRFSPFTPSPAPIRLSVRVNRWIEA